MRFGSRGPSELRIDREGLGRRRTGTGKGVSESMWIFFIRTQGLVSSAEGLGVTRDRDEEKSTEQTEASPTLDRAALYR